MTEELPWHKAAFEEEIAAAHRAGLTIRITFRVQCRNTGRWGSADNEHPKVNGMRPVLWDRMKSWQLVDPKTFQLSSVGTGIPGFPGRPVFRERCTLPYPHARHPEDD